MSDVKPLDVVLIGCGRMGYAHARRLQQDERARIVALFDQQESAARRLQQELLPEADVAASWEVLLDSYEPDAVVISTPTTSHYEQVVACRRRGWHVLCEKPLAETREHILALIQDTARGGPHLMVGYQRRFWATYRTLRREVLSGQWGPVQAVTSHNVENWQQTIAGTWRDDPRVNWGGFVGDAGSHKIDALFYTTGVKPASVLAYTYRLGSHVEVAATVSARCEGGIPVGMDFIGNAQYLGEDLHVHCAEADLMIRHGRLWMARNGEMQPLEHREGDSNPTVGFLDLLTAEGPNRAPADCALPVFDFTHAVLESSRLQRPMAVGQPSDT